MEELTLARFVLEMSLMDYDLIEERESFIAAASLLLARKMKHPNDNNIWVKKIKFIILQFYVLNVYNFN